MNSNLFSRLETSKTDPKKIAVTEANGRTHTYDDLTCLSGKLANVLVTRGVKPGDRVMVQVEKSVAAVGLYLATLRAGAIFLPLNSSYTLAEMDYFVRDAQPALIVCDPSAAAGILPIADTVGAVIESLGADGTGTLTDSAARAAVSFDTVWRGPDDLAAILYTSGTTGRAKGAMLTHGNLDSNAQSLIDAWKFTKRDVLIHALPIFHTHGLFVATNVTLFAGASFILLPKFDAEEILNWMPLSTVLMGVPTFYVRLLQSLRIEAASRKMRLFVSGSAPLLPETHSEWLRRTGHAIIERYGMTETNMNTSNPYDGDRVPGSVGLPLPGISIQITNPETGDPLGVNEIGMLEIKGPNVFKGYWQMPDKTAAEIRDNGYFITGDLGKIDERGYVHILGRSKDLVITGGFNVYPKEVEAEIDAVSGVLECAVIGIPHKDFGEGVTAVVIGEPGSNLTEASILAAISNRLAKFKHPKSIMFLDSLPRNAMGKVLKNLLREQFWNLYDQSHR